MIDEKTELNYYHVERPIKKYVLVMADNRFDFEKDVETYLKKGYHFFGDLKMIGGYFFREMVKYDNYE